MKMLNILFNDLYRFITTAVKVCITYTLLGCVFVFLCHLLMYCVNGIVFLFPTINPEYVAFSVPDHLLLYHIAGALGFIYGSYKLIHYIDPAMTVISMVKTVLQSLGLVMFVFAIILAFWLSYGHIGHNYIIPLFDLNSSDISDYFELIQTIWKSENIYMNIRTLFSMLPILAIPGVYLYTVYTRSR